SSWKEISANRASEIVISRSCTPLFDRSRSLPRRRSTPQTACLSRLREESSFEGAHGHLLCGFGVVPTADVEGAVRREEAQFVGGGPAHVAGLAAAACLGLLDGAFD